MAFLVHADPRYPKIAKYQTLGIILFPAPFLTYHDFPCIFLHAKSVETKGPFQLSV